MEKFKDRMSFVDYWAKFVVSHLDRDWSKQQNELINSLFISARQWSRREYLELKGEKCLLVSKV